MNQIAVDNNNNEKIDSSKNMSSIKNKMLNTFKKSFTYIGVRNEKYHFYSPISETALTDTEFYNSEGEPNTPFTEKQFNDDIKFTNFKRSNPSKLIYVPKNLSTLNEQNNNNDNQNSINNNNYIDINMNKNYYQNNYNNNNNNNNNNVINHSLNTNETKIKQNSISNFNNHTYITTSSISKMYKSKKLLLPRYLMKRQSTFSKNEIKTFYNYNKCSDYWKYENYFARTHHLTEKEDIIDISLDKTAIELKELNFNNNNNNLDEQNENTFLTQQTEDSTDLIVEKEIAQKIDGIVLNEVQHNIDNSTNLSHTIIDNTSFSSINLNDNIYINDNITDGFHKDSTYPALSSNIYPVSDNSKDNIISTSPTQQQSILSPIENYKFENFIC
eukprot:jgi/Orpsp1_1/1183758/evm.model.c7180000086624.1